MHDEEDFPEPNAFRPERFIAQSPTDQERKSPPDPRTYVFGYGRRWAPSRSAFQLIKLILTIPKSLPGKAPC
jgi:cytochrome P450